MKGKKIKYISLVPNILYISLWIIMLVIDYFFSLYIPTVFYVVSFVMCFMVMISDKDIKKKIEFDLGKVE